MRGRPLAANSQPPRALAPLYVAVLAFLLAGLSVGLSAPTAAHGETDPDQEWTYIGRIALVASGNVTYLATLWTDASTQPFPLEPAPHFRFVVTHSDGRPVAQAPAIRIQGWPCPDEVCPAAAAGNETFHALLVDGDDGAIDGTLHWDPGATGPFKAAGAWRTLVATDGAPLGAGTTWDIVVVGDPPATTPSGAALAALREFFSTPIGHIVALVLWLAGFYVLARLVRAVLSHTILSGPRVDPTIGRLTLRLASAVILFLGVGVSMWVVFGVNFWAGLTALGLLSVALGFGMQTTVANLMGGINLALDRPFVLGDRIQVGDTWGDVQEIGLRSTRILTTKHEVVIIPNKVLDEREIWNYTIQHAELRLDIDVGISYDSDQRLAEALMLQAAHDQGDVLAYPRPRVLLMTFGDSSVNLQLRAWIPSAKDARVIASSIRSSVKRLFDEHGVAIPFPHRTLVEAPSLAKPHKATDKELEDLRVRDPRIPKMVYATAGPQPIRPTADLICHVAAELGVGLVVLHVTRVDDPKHHKAATRVLRAFRDAAAHHGVITYTEERTGDVLPAIEAAIREHDAQMLAIGSSKHSLVSSPRLVAGLTKQIREAVDVPVLIVPRSLRVNDRTLEHFARVIAERHAVSRQEKGIEGKPDEAPRQTGRKSDKSTRSPAAAKADPGPKKPKEDAEAEPDDEDENE